MCKMISWGGGRKVCGWEMAWLGGLAWEQRGVGKRGWALPGACLQTFGSDIVLVRVGRWWYECDLDYV